MASAFPLDDILVIPSPGVMFHVLRDPDENALYLIDGGFLFGVATLRRQLARRGWETLPIKGIILTHGHLDHTWNVARLVAQTGAWVAAPRGDALHLQGRHPYTGTSRVCGLLERTGRALFGYRQFQVDHWIEDGFRLPCRQGLQAVHLPGHTAGHMGFLSPCRRLLFTGDLFASFGRWSHFPPNILNMEPGLIAVSALRVLAMDLHGVLPNHGTVAPPDHHLDRLRDLTSRYRTVCE